MANTSTTTAVQQWESKFHEEYVRESRFFPYSGQGPNNVIQVNERLSAHAGDRVHFQLVTRLTNAGVTGSNTLEGNEEALGNYTHAVNVSQLRNGVVVSDDEQQKTNIDFANAARDMLKSWMMEQDRDDIIAAMQSPVTDGVTAYADATEAQKDTWVAAQNPAAGNHRVLFGAVTSNYSASDHSASLSNVDSTSDKLSPTIVSLAKRLALNADPHIRPIRTSGDEEWYVMFTGTEAFRDLSENTSMQQANRDGWIRGRENPLFTAGDLIWDGVIIRQVPEIGTIAGVGAASIDVAPAFLCGAQTIGHAMAKRTTLRFEERDYQDKKGVAVAQIRGIEKLSYNSVQHGMVTVYVSGVAD